jgi:TolA-binding protein
MTFQSLFDIHGQGNHIIRYNNSIIELYYLLGLTYYKENSHEAIALFDSSLKTTALPESQRADILYKLSECYRNGQCGTQIDILKADTYLENAKQYGPSEFTRHSIFI